MLPTPLSIVEPVIAAAITALAQLDSPSDLVSQAVARDVAQMLKFLTAHEQTELLLKIRDQMNALQPAPALADEVMAEIKRVLAV